MPHLLTDYQKENCVEISHQLLANANVNKNFLKNIVTGYETWVYGYDVETKMQSSQWMKKGSPRPPPQKDELVKDRGIKVMLCFLFVKALSIMNLYHMVRW